VFLFGEHTVLCAWLSGGGVPCLTVFCSGRAGVVYCWFAGKQHGCISIIMSFCDALLQCVSCFRYVCSFREWGDFFV